MYTWRGSFIIIGCISFLWVLLWAVYFRDDPRTHPAISREEIANLPSRASLQHEARRAVLETSEAHDAGDGDRLLLRLDPLALPQLDPVVLPAPVSARPEKIGAFRIGRVFRRRGRRYGRRLRQRPHSEEDRPQLHRSHVRHHRRLPRFVPASCCPCCTSRT